MVGCGGSGLGMGSGIVVGRVRDGGGRVAAYTCCWGVVAGGRGRVRRGDGTAHVPPPGEGTLHMGNNPCRLAADMV